MKKRLFSFFMVLALTISFLGLIPASAASSTIEISVSGIQKNDMAFVALEKINAERNSLGVGSLVMDKNLMAVASQRAAEISIDFSHKRPDGRTCFEGFESYSYRGSLAENIAYGFDTGSDVYKGWKDSEKHHKAYINGVYTKTGLACLEVNGVHYWVQVFQNGTESTPYTQKTNFSVVKTVKLPNNSDNQTKYMPGSTPEITSINTDANGRVTITWDAVQNATGYRIYRYYPNLKGYNIIKEIDDGTIDKFVDYNVAGGDTPKYKLKAYRQIGSMTTWTPFSGCKSILVKPVTPSIYSSETTADSIKLNWTYSKCSGYKIYKDNNGFKMIKELPDSNTTSYTVTDLQPGTEYKFKIRSFYILGATYIYSNYSEEYVISTKSLNAANAPASDINIMEESEGIGSAPEIFDEAA